MAFVQDETVPVEVLKDHGLVLIDRFGPVAQGASDGGLENALVGSTGEELEGNEHDVWRGVRGR